MLTTGVKRIVDVMLRVMVGLYAPIEHHVLRLGLITRSVMSTILPRPAVFVWRVASSNAENRLACSSSIRKSIRWPEARPAKAGRRAVVLVVTVTT
jgi:hypothetical protein